MGAFLLNRVATRLKDHVARAAIRLPMPFDGERADIACLSCLDGAVANADIVVLGELNHFVHEKSDFRLFLCRYLLSRGFTTFAEELGWSDGVRVNRYLETGNGGELRRLPSFGYSGHKRSERDDRPTGILRHVFDAYPTDLFLAEQMRFYRGLRAAARGEKPAYFGFDIDGSPGGGYEDIAQLLAGSADAPQFNRFRSAFARIPGESVSEEAERLRRARMLVPDSLPASLAHILRSSLSALVDSLDYIAATYGAKIYDELRPGMALREDAMKRRLADIEVLSGARQRLVLMGHALHLVKDDGKLNAHSGGVGPGGGRTRSLGHHLAVERGKRVFAIWFLYGAGEDSQPFPELPRCAAFSKDTLNATLADLGCGLLFRTDDGVFREPVPIGQMYNAVFELSLGVHADAAFFLPRVTPLCA